MHSAPDYNLDAGKVVIGVVVSVILICATSMKELKILYGQLRSRVSSAPSSENNARVDGSKNSGETLHAAVTSELSTSELSAHSAA